jgi:6-phosphogluconate dehydrogenase
MVDRNRTAAAHIGVVGLAVMGSNLARNFARHGYGVALYNRTQARTEALMAAHGSEGTFVPCASVAEFTASLERPRRILLMVQAGPATDATIDTLTPHLEAGDIVVDGGNAHYQDTRRREARLREHGLHFVGAGISGGEEGALHGPSIMPGGSRESYRALGPLLEEIAAKYDGQPCCAWMGPDGAGHFVKMVHNGIEYGVMAAYAEGLGVLRSANIGKQETAVDAETTPLRDPEHYQYELNLRDIAEVWRRGSVIASWLLDLTAAALVEDPGLSNFAGRVSDSGEGRWTIKAAIDEAVPVPVLSAALYQRFSSRGDADYQDKLLSAMRFQFGGHVEKGAGKTA